MEPVTLGVIGGSGLYEMEGLSDIEEIYPDTPFGKPSDAIIVGTLEGKRVAFLPRHGRGHRLLPHEVPVRANILALKQLGCQWVVAVSACGSLREEYAPGDIVIPSGLFDRTHGRESSFFGDGLVGHVSVADPFCGTLAPLLYEAVHQTEARVHHGGHFVIIQGPRFSTKTESHLYRKWGMSLVGMTAIPEAFLAREAEMAYAVMAHVTDYDVWHEEEEPVTVEKVVETLKHNVTHAKQALRNLISMLEGQESEAWHALRNAVMTHPSVFNPDTRARLAPLLDKYYP